MTQNPADDATYGIDLSKDWTNASLIRVRNQEPRPFSTRARKVLWYDERAGVIYGFGGQQNMWGIFNVTPEESIWGFQENLDGKAAWNQVVGVDSAISFPSDIFGTARGKSCSDEKIGYYLGGIIWPGSSPKASNLWFNRGLLRFDFETLQLTNSSELGFQSDPGALMNVPIFGPNGVLIALGGGVSPAASPSSLDRINIFDKEQQKWHYQIAEGDIPSPRRYYCAVGVQGKGHESFEM